MTRRVQTPYGVELRLDDAPVDEPAIVAFEARIGHPLPDDYRQFLLMYNGGKPKPANFQFARRKGPYTDSLVNWFFALGSSPANDLDWNRRTFRERIPASLLPIADDPGGNVICIGLGGDERGRIYFWDHERESYPSDWSNIDLVADSFDAFLRGLTRSD